MYKTIETCQFKRTESSEWEQGFNLDDGVMIIDLNGVEVEKGYELWRWACEAPEGKSFNIQKVEGGLSIVLTSEPVNNKPYDYIRAWGQILGSYPYYVSGEIEKARKDNAPYDAVYNGHDAIGSWHTFESIKSDQTKERVQRLVDTYRTKRGEIVPEPKRLSTEEWKTILSNLDEDDEVEIVWLDTTGDEPSEWCLCFDTEMFEDRFVSEKQANDRLVEILHAVSIL